MKLCGLSPNFYIHKSVSDLYIPMIGLPIWLQQNGQNRMEYIYLLFNYSISQMV
jgi:hypothetical protein